jgi:hypothetical protein
MFLLRQASMVHGTWNSSEDGMTFLLGEQCVQQYEDFAFARNQAYYASYGNLLCPKNKFETNLFVRNSTEVIQQL